MTGSDLKQLLLDKWGVAFDVRLRRSQNKFLVQIMWRYLGQKSFPMTDDEYLEHLNAVASYISAWNGDQQVRDFIDQTSERPRVGVAVSILLDDLGERASEWLME